MAAAVLLAVALAAGCGSSVRDDAPAVVPHAVAPDPVVRRPTHLPAYVGRLNPDVTQSSIHKTVCIPGWTAKIRPPSRFTNKIKRMQLPPGADPKVYTEDHLMPLGLGGAAWDPKNLQPIPLGRAKLDDVWETRLHKMLCDGEVSLVGAQRKITSIKRRP